MLVCRMTSALQDVMLCRCIESSARGNVSLPFEGITKVTNASVKLPSVTISEPSLRQPLSMMRMRDAMITSHSGMTKKRIRAKVVLILLELRFTGNRPIRRPRKGAAGSWCYVKAMKACTIV